MKTVHFSILTTTNDSHDSGVNYDILNEKLRVE